MEKQEFTRKDETKGINYIPQENDVVVSKMSNVWQSDEMQGQYGLFRNYGLKVEHEHEEIFIRLTKNQYNSLSSYADLTNKTLEFTGYDKLIDGKTKRLVGVKVLKL